MWIRRLYIRMLLVTIPAWILFALTGPDWAWIGLGVGGAIWLQGFISLNFRIKRLRSVPPNN